MSYQYANNPVSNDGTSIYGGGGGSTTIIDAYPPVSTSTTAAPSSNVARQLYNAIGTGGTTVVDVYPPVSASTTSVVSARVATNTYNLANTPATTSVAGQVQLNDTTASTSTTLAATANMINYLASTSVSTTGLTTATNFGGSAAGTITLCAAGKTLNVNGTVVLGADQVSAYQVSVNSGVINVGCSASSFGATVNIGSATSTGAPNTSIGTIATAGSATTNIGTGSGTGAATVNIANGTNSGVNSVNLGNSNTNLLLKGYTYNIPNNVYPPTSTTGTDTASVNVVRQVYNLAATAASTSIAGQVQLNDTTASTSTTQAATANMVNYLASTAVSTTGLTTAVNFGTSAAGAVSVGVSGQNLTLQGISNPIAFQLAFSDEATALTTSNQVNIRTPFAFNVRSGLVPLFMLSNVGTAGTTTFDIMKNGSTIYSTKPVITYTASPTNSQFTSAGWTPGVLASTTTSFSQYDKITVYVFTAGGTGHLGGKCIIFAS